MDTFYISGKPITVNYNDDVIQTRERCHVLILILLGKGFQIIAMQICKYTCMP